MDYSKVPIVTLSFDELLFLNKINKDKDKLRLTLQRVC